MIARNIRGLAATAALLTLGLGGVANGAANLLTVVGGASGMTLDLNPYGTLVRGCAPKMLDVCLKNKRNDPDTGEVKYAYARARISGVEPYSEPNADTASWAAGQAKFTGDKKDTEIEYCKLENGDIWYSICIRADSVLGLRYVVNRQNVSGFSKCSGSSDSFTFATSVKTDATLDADFAVVKADIDARITAGGIPIEGGLTECYIESGVNAIYKYNRLFPAPEGGITQPQLNPANLTDTPEYTLSVAVMAVIYNQYVQDSWSNGEPVNFTTQMMRMIEGGMVDTWDYFFSTCTEENADHKRIFNYFREPLSGTGITWLGQVMRGVETSPNGSVAQEYWDFSANDGMGAWVPANSCASGANYNCSGVPGLTCLYDPKNPKGDNGTTFCLDYNPGGGSVNKAVNNYYGGIGYTFLQKFTKDNGSYSSDLARIRVARVNGYEPCWWDENGTDETKNSLPGVNGCKDVTYARADGKSFYQNVIDGRYPLWTYNHCFARPDAGTGLINFIEKFTNVNYEQYVRDVGLIPINDMDTYANYRSIPASGPNANRGKGLGRCGYFSPLTHEIVRDGMMMMPKDQDAADEKKLPAEGYPEMRP